MSNTSGKNILLSQPKIGQTDSTVVPPLAHTVLHDGNTTVIKIEIPGVDPSTVDVGCEGHLLKVHCERGEYTHPVDPTVDTSEIKADILWGLLTLTVPMPAPPVSRSIRVSIHDATKSAKSKLTAAE